MAFTVTGYSIFYFEASFPQRFFPINIYVLKNLVSSIACSPETILPSSKMDSAKLVDAAFSIHFSYEITYFIGCSVRATVSHDAYFHDGALGRPPSRTGMFPEKNDKRVYINIPVMHISRL